MIAVAVGFFACWGYAESIYDFMQRPIMDALHKQRTVGETGLSEPHRAIQSLLEGWR